jgi:hypothetical protein
MSGAALLEQILDKLNALPPEAKEAVKQEAYRLTQNRPWVPNPGPQADAVECEADELFYGGQAGGGKTDLGLGLALTAHKRTLAMRRFNKDAVKLVERMREVLGHKDGYNGQDHVWRFPGGRRVDFSGCEHEQDKQRYKGDPHDLKFFDEIGDFLESQYTFIIGWNRSADDKQRCRILCTGNPPTNAEGLWVVKRWGAWLDPNHPRPAAPGELRWYTTIDGKDTEVDGPGPHDIPGEPRPVMARSRTFLPASLDDNIDLLRSGYAASLAAMPEPYRTAYRDGRFDVALKDDDRQLIPTAWIRAAQARWTDKPPAGIPMCAIGADVAGGGEDDNVLAPRYDGYYPPLTVIPGHMTPTGTSLAGQIVGIRRNGARVIVDMGGGYGGTTYSHLKANEIDVVAYKGAEASVARTADGKLGFVNKRSEAWWKFREALDPGQERGSPIQLPDDPELVADLVAPHFEVGPRGIKVEAKESVVERLGRSPDRGDAVVIAWWSGPKAITHAKAWSKGQGHYQKTPNVVVGRLAGKKHRSQ